MILRNTLEPPMLKLLKSMLPVVLSTVIGVGSSLVTMRVQVESITATLVASQKQNEQIAADVKEVKNQQRDIFQTYYLPNKKEWNDINEKVQHSSADIENMHRDIQTMREDITRCMYDQRSRGYGYGK